MGLNMVCIYLWKNSRVFGFAVAAVKSFPFIILEVGGTALIGVLSSNPWLAVIWFFGLLLALYIGATATAPIRQRDEARAMLLSTASYGKGATLSEFVQGRDYFTLKEAACIKAGQPITNGEVTGVAAGYLYDLIGKVVKSEIEPHRIPDAQLRLAMKFHKRNPSAPLRIMESKGMEDKIAEVEVSKQVLRELGFIT